MINTEKSGNWFRKSIAEVFDSAGNLEEFLIWMDTDKVHTFQKPIVPVWDTENPRRFYPARPTEMTGSL